MILMKKIWNRHFNANSKIELHIDDMPDLGTPTKIFVEPRMTRATDQGLTCTSDAIDDAEQIARAISYLPDLVYFAQLCQLYYRGYEVEISAENRARSDEMIESILRPKSKQST